MSQESGLQAHLRHASERTLEVMRAAGAEAVIAASPANIRYLTGTSGWTQSMHITNQSYVLLTAEGKKILVLPSTDGDFLAMNDYAVDEVRTFGTFYLEAPEPGVTLGSEERHMAGFAENMVTTLSNFDALRDAVEAEGLSRATLLVDPVHMMPAYWARLQETLPGATLLDGYAPLLRARAIKSEYEIDLLRHSSACTEQAILDSLETAMEGGTDADIRNRFQQSLVDSGAVHIFSAIGVGSRTCFPNVLPDGTKPGPGDIIRYDVGCSYNGYTSDLARNAVLGEAGDKLRRYYSAMLDGEEAALEAMRPGARAGDIFDIAMDVARKSGVPHYRRHHCGHAIGLDVYEAPIIRPGDSTPLEVGMTFCIETPYYELGFGGVQVEDMVVVREHGVELLTNLSRKLFEMAA